MKNLYLHLLAATLLQSFCQAQPINSPTLPAGQRFANNNDYVGVHPLTRGKATPRVEADFDGNKLKDIAALVVSTENKGWGLYVFLQMSASSWKSIPLVEIQKGPNDSVSRYGLFLVKPGTYKTYCYHQPESCLPDQPKKITLDLPAFETVEFESRSGIYYWDRLSKTFKVAPMSD